jgi:ribonuclease P protein component
MTRRDDFARVVRVGRRAGRPTLVAHLAPAAEPAGQPARVGLVVSRRVGTAVVRHRVSRRLRHQMSERVGRLRPDDLLVLRAQPAAAAATSALLGEDLDRVLDRLLGAGRP